MIDKKNAIFTWRVKAMLNYLKTMAMEKDCTKEEIAKVIDNYIKFTDETSDCAFVFLRAIGLN